MLKRIFIVLAACLVLLGTCSLRGISERDLVGKYKADFSDDMDLIGTKDYETLELLPNGECVQEIHLSEKVYTTHGKWDYDKLHKQVGLWGLRQALTLHGKPNPDIEKNPEKASLGTSVSRAIGGRIKIMLTENIDYIKISN